MTISLLPVVDRIHGHVDTTWRPIRESDGTEVGWVSEPMCHVQRAYQTVA